MSTFQKLALLIGVLILVTLVAIIGVLLTYGACACEPAPPTSHPATLTAAANAQATQASIDYGSTLAVVATQTEAAREAFYGTATAQARD